MERFQIAETYSDRFKENIFCCGYLFATIVGIFAANLKNCAPGFYSLPLKFVLRRKYKKRLFLLEDKYFFYHINTRSHSTVLAYLVFTFITLIRNFQ